MAILEPPPHPTPEVWLAGDIAVDAGLQRVEQGGTVVELPRLSFDLLLALVQAAPNFVSNEELMQRVWRGSVVSPETVTQRVKLLRDALGDDPRQPRYIEGLRGRGYRFIPQVSRRSAVSETRPQMAAAGRPPVRWPAVLISVGLVALLAGCWVLWRNVESAGPRPAVAAADRTVAVLPFQEVLTAGNTDELGSGFAESILAQLSNVRELTVISRNSSFRVDAARQGYETSGQLLGARYLVDGSMQQLNRKLRVTVKLIDSNSGVQLWTRQFDGDVGNFYALQDAVAAAVVAALQSRIAGLDPAIPAGDRSSNPEAQLTFLRGRALLGRTTIVGSVAAEKEFLRATQLDPEFVPAITGLYDARLQAASLRRTGMKAALAANAPLLAKAAELRPDSGAVQLARAMWSDEPPSSRTEYFERGLAKDPANARAMTAYSELLDQMGRSEAGGAWLERALQIDPLWPRARFRAAQRNFPNVGSAIDEQNMRILELDPTYYPTLQRHAKYQWMFHGELAPALSTIEKAIATDPENPWGPHTAVAFYLDADEPDSAAAVVQGNSVADASTRAVRALYRGAWREAGAAAMLPGSHVFSAVERWGVAVALRDYALRGNHVNQIIKLLSDRYSLPLDADWQLGPGNFREAQLLAQLLLAAGQREHGMRRLDAVIAWIDANAYMGPVYNLRTRAQALALKGQSDAALATLADSFQQLDYTLWWYTLQYDPTWNELRADRRFVAIVTSVRAHIAGQKAQLAQLRRDGIVPDRRPAFVHSAAAGP
ncbi:MAG: winged helix-turn-helix domain-containing protein [Pseudomonadota bacterium]